MKRATAAVLGAVTAWGAWAVQAETVPGQGTTDSRIRTALYDADEVFKLYAYVGYHIDLEFEPDESFVDLRGGDLEALAYWGQGNILTIKPKAATTDMNLSVTTTKRRYYFEYAASARRPNRFADPVMYAVRFRYAPPKAAPPGPTAAERVEQALDQASRARPRNYDYWFCGRGALKPVAAWDDGVHTRLTFGNRAELPAVFVRNDDGSESLLNFSMDGAEMIIHRVARDLIVRRGKLTGCVVNKAYRGTGERLESGTVTPAVERQRKDAR